MDLSSLELELLIVWCRSSTCVSSGYMFLCLKFFLRILCRIQGYINCLVHKLDWSFNLNIHVWPLLNVPSGSLSRVIWWKDSKCFVDYILKDDIWVASVIWTVEVPYKRSMIWVNYIMVSKMMTALYKFSLLLVIITSHSTFYPTGVLLLNFSLMLKEKKK